MYGPKQERALPCVSGGWVLMGGAGWVADSLLLMMGAAVATGVGRGGWAGSEWLATIAGFLSKIK